MPKVLIADSITGKLPKNKIPANVQEVVTPEEYGAVGNGITDDTAAVTSAINEAISTGKEVYLTKTYKVTASLPIAANMTIRGRSMDANIYFDPIGGTGRLFDLTGILFVTLREFAITLAKTSNTTALYLNGTFRGNFDSLSIRGTNIPSALADYTQRGVELRGNSGDSRFTSCEFNNLGTGIATDSIMNYVIGCMFSSCRRGVHGDAGSFGAGLSIDNCTFVSGADHTSEHILVDVNANLWWITNTWFEGCDNGIVIGNGSGNGPFGVGIINCKVAATTRCIWIRSAKQTTLTNVSFEFDPAATPIELEIDSTNALDGVASNLLSAQVFDFAATVFPAGWTVLGRGRASLPPILDNDVKFTGNVEVMPTDTAEVPLIVRHPTGGLEDVFQVQAPDGSVWFKIDRFANLIGGGITATGGQLRCTSLSVGNSVAATTLGSVVRKVEVFDAGGTSIGFVPVYDVIT